MKEWNILLYRWNGRTEDLLAKNIRAIGHNLIEYDRPFSNYEVDAELMQELVFMKHQKNIEVILSFDYYPFLASTANVLKIPYISWIYDSPQWSIYSPTRDFDTNYIFSFDKSECEILKAIGCKRIYHMPLASCSHEFQQVIARDNVEPYYDISFVGSLYSKTDYDKINFDDAYFEGYLEGLMAAQHPIYGYNLIEATLSVKDAQRILELAGTPVPVDYHIMPIQAATYILERKLSAKERFDYLQLIGDKYDLYLFSGDDRCKDVNAKFMGTVSYDIRMPVVFNHTKINLDFTTRNIHSGVPLRVLDVLASEGFLLTAYQPEIDELFENGKELVMFSDEREMMEAIEYYLNHDDERKAIARKGYKKVAERFTYEKMLAQMIAIASGEKVEG